MLKYRAQKLIQERVNQLTIGEYRNLKRLIEQEQLPYDPNMPPPPPAPPVDPNMMAPPPPMDPAMMAPPPPAPPMDPSMMGGAPPMDPSMGMGGGMGGPPPPAGPKKLKIFQEELPESIKKLLKLPEYIQCKLSMKYGTNAVMNCIERIDHSKKIND